MLVSYSHSAQESICILLLFWVAVAAVVVVVVVVVVAVAIVVCYNDCNNYYQSGDVEKDKVRDSSKGGQSAHPTILIRRATSSLLRCLVISTGIHAEDIPMTLLKTVSGLLHTVLDKGSLGMLWCTTKCQFLCYGIQ